jgi:hypothetical protein
MAGRVVAAAGCVLVIIGIFLDAFLSTSYWNIDGTSAWFGLILAAIALAIAAAGYVGKQMDGWLFGIGALLIGYYAWFPVATAFDQWKHTGAGLWLTLVGAVLIAGGAATVLWMTNELTSTPAGTSTPALAAGLGIALCFPGIFLHADHGISYWNGPLGHSLGIVLLILTVLAVLVWGATVAGRPTKGLDVLLTLILLGLFAFDPVGSAFNQFGSLGAGAWIGLAGGILAAGGTWAARGAESPRTVAAPA